MKRNILAENMRRFRTKNLNEAPQAEDLVDFYVFRDVIKSRISKNDRGYMLTDSNTKHISGTMKEISKKRALSTYKHTTSPKLFKRDEELTLDFGISNDYDKNMGYVDVDSSTGKALIANELVRGKITDDGDGGDPYVYFVLGKKQAPDFMVDNFIIQVFFPGSKIQSGGRKGVVTGGDLQFKDPGTGEWRKAKD